MTSTNPAPDRLPPHDTRAEMAVLSCCLGGSLAAMEDAPAAFTRCREQFGDDAVFYDLRHQLVWHAMLYLHEKAGAFDMITLGTELRARGKLEEIGGHAYLSAIQDAAVSPAFLENYIGIVWERYIARRKIAYDTEVNARIMESGELTESHVAVIENEHAQWKALLTRGAITPKNLCPPAQFGDEYYNQWFNRQEETFGYHLPFAFPLRYRPAATTLMTGDNGSGKSSMLCLQSIVIMTQLQPGEKLVMASMEMPPEVTLWIMARQLMGVGSKLEATDENKSRVAGALAWLNARMLLYNFLGITDKRDLMHAFQYAAEHQNGKFFVIDNMMKVGIADDDYAAQGFFIQQVCDFDLKQKAHTIVVVHENKGDGSTKQKVRGSKQLTDAPDNVVKMERNEDKATKLAELKAEEKAFPDNLQKKADIAEARGKLANQWDSKFVLCKQRWPGARQNGSAWLYFHHESLQFHEEPNKGAFEYAEIRGTKHKTQNT